MCKRKVQVVRLGRRGTGDHRVERSGKDDRHPKDKAKAGTHRLIFGNVIRTGPNKNQIKLATPEWEKVFPLERMEIKTKPIADGDNIVVELNEEGTVIDLWKAQ